MIVRLTDARQEILRSARRTRRRALTCHPVAELLGEMTRGRHADAVEHQVQRLASSSRSSATARSRWRWPRSARPEPARHGQRGGRAARRCACPSMVNVNNRAAARSRSSPRAASPASSPTRGWCRCSATTARARQAERRAAALHAAERAARHHAGAGGRRQGGGGPPDPAPAGQGRGQPRRHLGRRPQSGQRRRDRPATRTTTASRSWPRRSRATSC